MEKNIEFKSIKYDDQSLKQSEYRKPIKDILNYSNSCVESIPLLKKPSEQIRMNQTQHNVNNQKQQQSRNQEEDDSSLKFHISDGLRKHPSLMKNKEINLQQEQIRKETIRYYRW